jgi:signal transduction histidine kinase
MRSRIATIGATMEFESDGRGTRIEIHRPRDRTDSEESTTR